MIESRAIRAGGEVSIFSDQGIGDYASMVGLAVSLLGFYFTIKTVQQAKTASDAANESAKAVRSAIRAFDSAADASSALSKLEEIKRLHRSERWEILPERYSELKVALKKISRFGPNLTKEQLNAIQKAVVTLSDMEELVDRVLTQEHPEADVVRLNKLTNEVVNDVLDIFMTLKDEAEGRPANGQ